MKTLFTFAVACSVLIFVGCTDLTFMAEKGLPSEEKIETRSMDTPSFEFPEIDWAVFDTHAQKVAFVRSRILSCRTYRLWSWWKFV